MFDCLHFTSRRHYSRNSGPFHFAIAWLLLANCSAFSRTVFTAGHNVEWSPFPKHIPSNHELGTPVWYGQCRCLRRGRYQAVELPSSCRHCDDLNIRSEFTLNYLCRFQVVLPEQFNPTVVIFETVVVVVSSPSTPDNERSGATERVWRPFQIPFGRGIANVSWPQLLVLLHSPCFPSFDFYDLPSADYFLQIANPLIRLVAGTMGKINSATTVGCEAPPHTEVLRCPIYLTLLYCQ